MTTVEMKPDAAGAGPAKPGSRHTRIALVLIWSVAGMLALSYASVPLYRLYCQVTGYGGTTQKALSAPGTILPREVTVTFDATAQPGVPWSFKPLQGAQTIHIGEISLAKFRVKNNSAVPVTASATFNVLPAQAGRYFNKIYCFCFTQQTLQPGEEKDLPVSFFVDPKIASDRGLDDVKTLTLSYTFFRRDGLGG